MVKIKRSNLPCTLKNKIRIVKYSINLRKKGYSYSEISKKILNKLKLKLNDTTILDYVKNVKMTKLGKIRYNKKISRDRSKAGKLSSGPSLEISLKNLQKAIIFHREKAKNRIKKQNKNLSLEKVRIIGHCLFDGSVINSNGYYCVNYSNNCKNLINKFKKDIWKVYNIKPTDLRKNGKLNVLRYCSKALVENLNKYTNYNCHYSNIPNQIFKSRNKHLIIEFLRTFWDDEGMVNYGYSLDRNGYKHIKRQLEAYCDNNIIREKLKKLHNKIGIQPKLYNKKIIISRFDDLKRFSKLINFSKGLRVSYPKSKNHNIEKRYILNKAVKGIW